MYTFAPGLFTLKVGPFTQIIKKYFNEHKGYLNLKERSNVISKTINLKKKYELLEIQLFSSNY